MGFENKEFLSNIYRNSKSKLHAIDHIERLLAQSRDLVKQENLIIDDLVLNQAIYCHDLGKAILGDNPITLLLDGPSSSYYYKKFFKTKKTYNEKVDYIIYYHTRLFWFLGPKIDHFLYKPKYIEEKILWDTDLLDMINPSRLYTKDSILLITQINLAKIVSSKHLYFGWSKNILEEFRIKLTKK